MLSILTDINVLVEAAMPGAPKQQATQRWLVDRLIGSTPFNVYEPILASFVRIVTLPVYQAKDDNLGLAMQFAEGVRSAPAARLVTPSAKHWAIFRGLMETHGVRGKRTSDAYLAALAIDLDATFYSFDKGFANYPGLKWRLPEI